MATGVEGLSFSIREGETLALLGPNGSGKTTVIKLLAGLLIPTCGRITIGGADIIQNRKKALERVGVVLGDARSVYWRLTGRDNLEYFGTLRGVYGKKLNERIAALAKTLDFEGVLDRRAGELSRGMRQRLLIAIALLPEPRLLILDEPTFGLDVASRREIRRLLHQVASIKKCATVIATHQMDEAEELASYVCILRQGRAAALDTIQDLIANGQGIRGGKARSSSWLEEVFLEVTKERSEGRAESSHDRVYHPPG